LEIDFEPALMLSEAGDEIGLTRDSQAVGVDHHVPHRPRADEVEHLEELRMQRRLAAGNLHDVGVSLAPDQGVYPPLDGREREMLAARRRGVGEADRTGQVAMLVDLDQRQTRVLLVVGAQSAVVGTAEFSPALQAERAVAGLDVVLAQAPIGRVSGDERRLHAVALAALLVPDFVVLDGDLGRDQRETDLAHRGGLAPEHVGARSTQRHGHRRASRLAWWRSSPPRRRLWRWTEDETA